MNNAEELWTSRKLKTYLEKKDYEGYMRNLQTTEHNDFNQLNIDRVRELVSSLPTGELAVVYLMFWENQDEIEISQTLSMPRSQVKLLLASGLGRIKNALNKIDEKEAHSA